MAAAYEQKIRDKLISWYRINKRNLPWRNIKDPYQIWVSEVMLQQTQVKTVIPYYLDFIDRFPSIRDLARANLDQVLKKWEGLGYYARARNFHSAAVRVVDEFNGQIPDCFNVFKGLPGVGDYIASAVMSIAFGLSHAVVDGNVKRVLSRLFMIGDPVNHSRSHAIFKETATRLMGRSDPEKFNQAIMELGALVCLPKNPKCPDCPVKKYCQAVQEQKIQDFPRRIQKSAVPTHHIAVGVVRKKDTVLITRRKPEGLLGGLWEFPGGRIKEGEIPADACIRELLEETGLTVAVESHLTRIKHAYTHFKIIMDIFYCRQVSGDIRLNGPVDFAWTRLEDLDRYAFPGANHKFIPLLEIVYGDCNDQRNPI